jgi:hypothetical protein
MRGCERVDIAANWGAALRTDSAGPQDESPCRAIRKQRPYRGRARMFGGYFVTISMSRVMVTVSPIIWSPPGRVLLM